MLLSFPISYLVYELSQTGLNKFIKIKVFDTPTLTTTWPDFTLFTFHLASVRLVATISAKFPSQRIAFQWHSSLHEELHQWHSCLHEVILRFEVEIAS